MPYDRSVASFNFKLDQSLPDHLPSTTTLRSLFTRYVDFNAVPRRFFFQYLRYFTTDELEQEKLDEFLSLEGAVSPSNSQRLTSCSCV